MVHSEELCTSVGIQLTSDYLNLLIEIDNQWTNILHNIYPVHVFEYYIWIINREQPSQEYRGLSPSLQLRALFSGACADTKSPPHLHSDKSARDNLWGLFSALFTIWNKLSTCEKWLFTTLNEVQN